MSATRQSLSEVKAAPVLRNIQQMLDIDFLKRLTPLEFSKIMMNKQTREELAYRLITQISVEKQAQRKLNKTLIISKLQMPKRNRQSKPSQSTVRKSIQETNKEQGSKGTARLDK